MIFPSLLTLLLTTIPVKSLVTGDLMAKMEKGETGGGGTPVKEKQIFHSEDKSLMSQEKVNTLRQGINAEQRTGLSTPDIGVKKLGKLGTPAHQGKKRFFISDPSFLKNLSEQKRFIIKKLELMKDEGEDKDMIHLEVRRVQEIWREINANISIIKKHNLEETVLKKNKKLPHGSELAIQNLPEKSMESQENVVESLLSSMKKLINDFAPSSKHDHLTQEAELTPWGAIYFLYWDYLFATLDFLLKNQLIQEAEYKKTLIDFQIVKELAGFIATKYTIWEEMDFEKDLFILTQHYSWKKIHLPLGLEKIAENKINLVYLMEKIGNDSSRLLDNPKHCEKIANFLSGGSYFHKLKYAHRPIKNPRNKESQISPLVLSDPEEFKEEIKNFVTLVLRLIKRESIYTPGEENIWISICYLLGFIEEEIFPGIIDYMIPWMTFLYDGIKDEPTLQAKKDKLQIVYLTLKFDILLETSYHYSQEKKSKENTEMRIICEELKNKATLAYYDIKEIHNRMCQRYSPIKLKVDSRDIFFSQIIHQSFLKIVQEGPNMLRDCF